MIPETAESAIYETAVHSPRGRDTGTISPFGAPVFCHRC
jgi:hypothetical protein